MLNYKPHAGRDVTVILRQLVLRIIKDSPIFLFSDPLESGKCNNKERPSLAFIPLDGLYSQQEQIEKRYLSYPTFSCFMGHSGNVGLQCFCADGPRNCGGDMSISQF